jgi:hypothetical protein
MSRVPGRRSLSVGLWRPWRLLRGDRCRLDRPIFVVGCPRSGTTLFVNNLASHPALADWSEGLELWDAAWQPSGADHVRTAADVTPGLRRRLTAILSLYMWMSRRPRLVNKLPRNSLRIPYLATLFPDCRVIHVIRDGRSVVASLVQKVAEEPRRQGAPLGNFARPPGWQTLRDRPAVEQFAHLWARLVPHARDAGRGLPADAYAEVFYEEFCRDPRGSLARLYRWADVPAHPHLDAVPAHLTARNDKWRTTLSPAEQAQTVAIIGPLLESLGYEVAAGARS